MAAGPRCRGRRAGAAATWVPTGAGAGAGMRTPLRSTWPESRPPDSWVPCGSTGGGGAWPCCAGVRCRPCSGVGCAGCVCAGAGAACGSLQAPWEVGISRRSSSSGVCSEGSRKVYASGAGTPGCSTMPAFSGSPSAGTWPVSVMRTPRPSSVLLRPFVRDAEPRHAGARHQERAGSPRGTKRPRGFLFSRPFAAATGSSATAHCGLRHVARPPDGAVPQCGPKQSTFPDIDERIDEQPGAVQQSASLPRVPGRTGQGARSERQAESRNTTDLSRSVHTSVSRSTDWSSEHSTV
ncbi:hypothetical protein QFZ71_000747 [Streptomyces sp. V2I9]|nr:hypothetical protein [Streptomyces sp. V2I9]